MDSLRYQKDAKALFRSAIWDYGSQNVQYRLNISEPSSKEILGMGSYPKQIFGFLTHSEDLKNFEFEEGFGKF